MEKAFYQLNAVEALKELNSSMNGLSESEAQKRLQEFGSNELVSKKKFSVLKLFFNQFTSYLVIILIIAAIISFLIESVIDAAVIGAIIIFNAVLGFRQEFKAEKAMNALKKMTAPKAIVIRNSIQQEIEAKNLVPGDLIILSEGDIVPSDARIIESVNLKTNEAILTGESNSIGKQTEKIESIAGICEQKNMVFSNTIVSYGRGKAVVTGTGMKTEFGKIALMLEEIKETETPLAIKLQKFGKKLAIIIIALVAMLFFLIIARDGLSFWNQGFLVAVSLAVSAIPEGLPAIVTITLALGMREIAKQKGIVRKMSAVEALGATTVICADKTGTITKNELSVERIWCNEKEFEVQGSGFSAEGKVLLQGKEIILGKEKELELIASAGINCNTAFFGIGKNPLGDPTEIALLVLGEKLGTKKDSEFVNEVPFDSDRKKMSSIYRKENGFIVYCKGSVESILESSSFIQLNGKISKITEKQKQKILQKNDELAAKGLRVLGFAFKTEKKLPEKICAETIENKLVFLGLTGMIDAPRKESIEAIKICQEAGIKVKMLTGDHALTAKAIALDLGLMKETERVITGKELEQMSEEQLRKEIDSIKVFARVSPKHKVRIINALRANNEVIAMTGDGVNDAPALKEADIGVAMGIKGTDVAKEASDIIITDDNFFTIVKAVEQGRKIYSNIKSFVKFLLSANFDELIVIATATIVGLPLPLLPVQILWLNLVTDGFPAISLGMEPLQKDEMKQKPRKKDESILHGMKLFIAVAAILAAIATMTAFLIGLNEGIENARAMAFTTSIFFELILVFNCRHASKTMLEIPFFSNKTLIKAVLISIVLQLIILYTPFIQPFFGIQGAFLGLFDWIIIIGVCLMAVFVPYIVRGIQKMQGKKVQQTISVN